MTKNVKTNNVTYKIILLAIFLSAIFLFLFSGLMQLYPQPGWVDAGYYTAYGLNLEDLIKNYGFEINRYQGSRVGYVFLLYGFNHLLPPLLARVALIVFLYALTMAAVIWLAKRVSPGSAAIFAAIVLATNASFLAALTFGGTDGAALAFNMVSAAFLLNSALTVASSPIRKKYLLLAGAFSGLALSTHIIALMPSLLLLAMFFIIIPGSLRNRKADVIHWVIGFLMALLFLYAVSLLFGFEKHYLIYSLEWSLKSLSGSGTAFGVPLSEWLYGATRWFFPVIICLLGVIRMLQLHGKLVPHGLLAAVIFLTATPMLFFLVLDFGIGGSILSTQSYYNIFMPCFFVAFIFLLSELKQQVASEKFLVLLSVSALSIALFFAIDPACLSGFDKKQIFLVLALICTTAGLLYIIFTQRKFLGNKISSAGLLVCLSAIFVAGVFNQESQNIFYRKTNVDYQEAYSSQIFLMESLKARHLTEGRPLFIFDRARLNQQIGSQAARPMSYKGVVYSYNHYDSLASLFLWDRSILSAELNPLQLENSYMHKNNLEKALRKKLFRNSEKTMALKKIARIEKRAQRNLKKIASLDEKIRTGGILQKVVPIDRWKNNRLTNRIDILADERRKAIAEYQFLINNKSNQQPIILLARTKEEITDSIKIFLSKNLGMVLNDEFCFPGSQFQWCAVVLFMTQR